MNDHPFSDEEKEIMDLLIEAHRKYCQLKPLHPSDITDWVNGLHKLQDILIVRTVFRKYPKYFNPPQINNEETYTTIS